MAIGNTQRALAGLTDEGHFERLATAILREANPVYRSLVHAGVNTEGKTVKSPLDGICFVQGAQPPHLIAVHHTITERAGLEKKWLHDPARVKRRRKSSRAALAPAGDLLKTSEVVMSERKNTPLLRATLVLTTNQEPPEDLIRSLELAARQYAIEIDMWSQSRLSHFLDNEPAGQWLRHQYLGMTQELLSIELLRKLSQENLRIHRPYDDPVVWVNRELDQRIEQGKQRALTFLIASSGSGKSVACHRALTAHAKGGGISLVLTHDAVASSLTVDQAIAATLRQLHPTLTELGPTALSLVSTDDPISLTVEDINRSGQAQTLVDRLMSWSRSGTEQDTAPRWRLLCPVWPEVIASLGEYGRRRLEPFTMRAGVFTPAEARDAVIRREQSKGRDISALAAEEISRGLGYDPLLIALYHSAIAHPHEVIGSFVEGSISKLASATKDHPASDYRQAVRFLCAKMLSNSTLDVSWADVTAWAAGDAATLTLISRLAHDGEVIRFVGPSERQDIAFRHDRVRDWMLADAVGDCDRRDSLPDAVVAEPFYAEILGIVAATLESDAFLTRLASMNPLSLFCGLRILGNSGGQRRNSIVELLRKLLDTVREGSLSNVYFRHEAVHVLAETEAAEVPEFVDKLRIGGDTALLARFRNGDVGAGIELSFRLPPGVRYEWRDEQIQHAKHRYGAQLRNVVSSYLSRDDLNSPARIGALRLTGYLASPDLTAAIETCWKSDSERQHQLDAYLWAFAESGGAHVEQNLEAVCDGWAALPDEEEKDSGSSPRSRLAAHELRWAFIQWPPTAAIESFVRRARRDDRLRWVITYMLHEIDDPGAVLFVVEELAAIRRRLQRTESFSPFVLSASDDWRRAQENGRPMSEANRQALVPLWQDAAGDDHLRRQAFAIWAATIRGGDVALLRASEATGVLADDVLMARLIRRDEQAIPSLVSKIQNDESGRWWVGARHVWSSELGRALEKALDDRLPKAKRVWGESFRPDEYLAEIIQRIPPEEAERLLVSHWNHLQFDPHYVQSALYVARPSLLALARETVAACPEPPILFQHWSFRVGVRTKGREGLTRQAQVMALGPYLKFFAPIDIWHLWNECNAHGWFQIRRELVDGRMADPFDREMWSPARFMGELDSFAENKRPFWSDHLIDLFLKTGVPWSEIRDALATWLSQRRTLEALRVAAAIVAQRGTREGFNLLKSYDGMPQSEAEQLIADTAYAVRRRSLA